MIERFIACLLDGYDESNFVWLRENLPDYTHTTDEAECDRVLEIIQRSAKEVEDCCFHKSECDGGWYIAMCRPEADEEYRLECEREVGY